MVNEQLHTMRVCIIKSFVGTTCITSYAHIVTRVYTPIYTYIYAQRSYYIHTHGTYLGVLEYIIVAAVHITSSHRVPYNIII